MTDTSTKIESSPVHASATVGSLLAPSANDADLVEEILVEEVFIDTMCGVY